MAEGLTWLNDLGLYLSLTVVPGPPAYRVEYSGQDVSPSVLRPGEQAVGRFYLKNTGAEIWRKDRYPLRLGTSNPRDRNSPFHTPGSWVSPNRVANVKEDVVRPGETGTFEVVFTAPDQPGQYQEYFNPVAEGLTWLNDLGLYLSLTVEPWPPAYRVEFVTQDVSPVVLAPGEQAIGRFYLRNTGTWTWRKDQNPLLLGTSNPRDRNSLFYTPGSWASPNRVAYVKEELVRPGEVGTFEVVFTAPNQPGEYQEYFNPVAEGLVWLNDLGLYLSLRIVNR